MISAVCILPSVSPGRPKPLQEGCSGMSRICLWVAVPFPASAAGTIVSLTVMTAGYGVSHVGDYHTSTEGYRKVTL